MTPQATRPAHRPTSPRAAAPRLLLGCVAFLLLTGFRPFTPVTSVCPKCPVAGDRVTLKDDTTIVCKVVAKNQDGYVLERYGELRFAQFREVKAVKWRTGKEPLGLQGYDQVLIKNREQTLLHGTLISIEPGKPLALRGKQGQIFLIHPEQVLVYYQRGARKAPPKPPADEPAADAAPAG